MTQPKWTPEFFMHLAFFVAAVLVLTLSFTMKLVGSTTVYLPGATIPLPESCTTRIFFGINCPGCGLTRAFISISRGDFADAMAFNPAGFLIYLFVAVQIPWQIYQMFRMHRGLACVESFWVYLPLMAIPALLVIQWIVRLFVG